MKNIPMYDKEEIATAEQDGDTICVDFDIFLNELVDEDVIIHETERGVSQLAANGGTRVLSPKQLKVIDIVVEQYGDEECRICRQKIPLADLGYARENGGYCSYHAAQKDNEE